MGYNKLIKSGNTIEVFNYARELPVRPRAKRGVSHKVRVRSVAPDRGDTLRRDEYEGKRKDNVMRAKMVFRRLILSNLVGTDYPLLLTLTYKNNQTSIVQGYKDFSSFVKALRYKFGKLFRYVSVPEFQERGAVHFHAMFWGLPDTTGKTERQTRMVAKIWGHGYVDIKITDGSPKLAGYISKYMAKTFIDYRLFGQKAYTCSRNMKRPEVVSNISNYGIDTVLDETGASVPEIDKEYETMHLGKCRKRIYKTATTDVACEL
jgi:hypothetical protein